jgi:adenylate cyclase
VFYGFPLGLIFGLLELFLFPKAEKYFRSWSFTGVFVFKTLLYTTVIYLVTVSLAAIVGFYQGRRLSELGALLMSLPQLILVIYTLVVYALLVFFLQVNRLMGEGVLWKFIRGKYRRPREEERIFMFLDMTSSTTIAERLGHIRFYTLLNELFHEISQPVLQTGAEIYQYVGDEVVLTWELKTGLMHANCIQCFFMFRENIRKKTEYYVKTFGVEPAFKAGLHFGKVTSAQIGDLKREIVYNGDVLNTTARLRNECNNYQRDCLVSGKLMERIGYMIGYRCEKIDTVILRGKEKEVVIFSVERLKQTSKAVVQ